MSDDLENDDLDDTSFDDFEKKEGTLGDLWRENSLVKIGVIGAGAVLIFIVVTMMGGSEAPLAPSYVPAGSEITAAPGTEKASPAYIAAVEEQNQARLEEAQRTGGSSLPTPISTPVGRLTLPDEAEEEEDPLQRWRMLQEERLQRELQRTSAIQPEELDTGADRIRAEAIEALANTMAEQMRSILESGEEEYQVNSMQITDAGWLDKLKEQDKEEEEAKTAAAGAESAKGDEDDVEVILVPAGEIAYAQLLIEANSDRPGPVLAQIASGPLSGSRILGDFDVKNKLITLNFNSIIIDGVGTKIDAVALDPETALPGMATYVNHRYLQRIALPMAAAFIEGMAEAVSETGQTTITISGGSGGGSTTASDSQDQDSDQEVATGITEASSELREILDEITENIKVLVRIDAGTPIGLLFLEPVIAPPEMATKITSGL